MANPDEVCALYRIKLHLLGELSPIPIRTTSSTTQEDDFAFQFDLPNPNSSQSQSFTSDPTDSIFEFDTKPQIFDLETQSPKPVTVQKKQPPLSRRKSLEISLPKKTTEWIQFGEAPEAPETENSLFKFSGVEGGATDLGEEGGGGVEGGATDLGEERGGGVESRKEEVESREEQQRWWWKRERWWQSLMMMKEQQIWVEDDVDELKMRLMMMG